MCYMLLINSFRYLEQIMRCRILLRFLVGDLKKVLFQILNVEVILSDKAAGLFVSYDLATTCCECDQLHSLNSD
jgi:hypothetical protein